MNGNDGLEQFVFNFPVRAIVQGARQNPDGSTTREEVLCVTLGDKDECVALFSDKDSAERVIRSRSLHGSQIMAFYDAEGLIDFLQTEQKLGAIKVASTFPSAERWQNS